MKLLSDQVEWREIEVILRELRKTKDVCGDVVEFGCYVGTTSVFLARELEAWMSSKQLWLYDSFEGLPENPVRILILSVKVLRKVNYLRRKSN